MESYRRPERESLLLQITVKIRDSDLMLYLSQRAELNYELKREEIDRRKQQKEFEKKQMEVSYQQQMRIQRQK